MCSKKLGTLGAYKNLVLVEAVGGVLCVNPRDVVFFFLQPDRSYHRAADFVLIRTRLDPKESRGIP